MTPTPAWCAAAALLVGFTAVSAQQPQQEQKSKTPPTILTLSGCVTADPSQRNVFTLTDAGDPTIYRLTGTSVRKYVGQRVEVSGVASKRLSVTGGLYPNANVAGQAGAIDPVKAAIAGQTEGNAAATGRTMSDFRVKSVRTVPGPCPDK
jgi:outer membrane lipoprotein SlyB